MRPALKYRSRLCLSKSQDASDRAFPSPGDSALAPRTVYTFPKNKLEEVRVRRTQFHRHDLIQIHVWALRGDRWAPTRHCVTGTVRLLPELEEACRQLSAALLRETGQSDAPQECNA